MTYLLLLLLHLFAVLLFVGTVLFELFVLRPAFSQLSDTSEREVEKAIGRRIVRVIPAALVVLYAAGMGLAWHYRGVLAQPFASPFATLLWLKILLALSVLGHVIVAMRWRRQKRLHGKRSRILHNSVYAHMLLIVILAKAMFYV